MNQKKAISCFAGYLAGLLALAVLAVGCVDRRQKKAEATPTKADAELGTSNEADVPNEPAAGPASLEESDKSESEEDMKEPLKGPMVRVSISLAAPSVVGAGHKMRSITTDPEAQAYQARLKEEQEEIIRRIEEAIGHPLDVVWRFTLSTNALSANVHEADIQRILAVEGVVSVHKEQTYQIDNG